MKKIILLSGLLLLLMCVCVSAQTGSIYDNWQIVHNDLSLDIRDFETKTIAGTATITLTSKQDNASDLSLMLLKMEIDSVLLNGRPVKEYTYDSLRISVSLPIPAKKEEEVKLRIVYHGKPEGSAFGGFTFSDNTQMAHNMGSSFFDVPHSFGRSWFPAADDYRSRSTFDLHIRVNSPLKGICSGILVDTIPNGDETTTWHWRVNQPIPDYLVSVAVGNYEKIHMDYQQRERTLPIDIYVLPEEIETGHEAYAAFFDILAVFEDYFGEYIFDRVGFVSVNSPYGAMEHVGNIAMPLLKTTYPTMYRELIIHELAHAWFGNQVTCATDGDMWLNEGFATFCPTLVYEKLFPDVNMSDYIRRMQVAAWMSAYMEGGYRALKDMPVTYTYSTSNYQKGGMVVHTLRKMLGDEVLMPVLREYLETYTFKHVSTDDFRQFLSSKLPNKFTDDFLDWTVYNPGFLAFEIDSVKGDMISEDKFQGQVYLEQKLCGAPEYGKNVRVPVTFFDESGTWGEKRYVRASGQYSDYPVDLPFKPAYGIVDPDYEMCKASLCDRMTVDTIRRVSKQYNQITLVCTSFTTPFSLYLENYKVMPDLPDDPAITGAFPEYWRITGVIPEGTGLNAIFAPERQNPEVASLLSSDKTLLMMHRDNPSSSWESLFEISAEMKKSKKITVEHLKTGEFCIAIKE